MIRAFGTLLLVMLTLGGCIHPPPPQQREVAFGVIPPKVIETFTSRFPDADVHRVVQWYFNRRVVAYYIDYTQSAEPVKTIAITPGGEVTEYGEHAPSQSDDSPSR